ncbi:MAG: hypothetical protein CMH60_06690 [Myxococcales bacterium]|nr:hypothetical protein [Myxococcales bacterium]
MRELKFFSIYVLAVAVVGCLLAPVLYELAQMFIEAGYFSGLARYRFQKYLNRAILITAFVFLPFFLKSLKISGWVGLGIEKNVFWRRDLMLGFLLAALSLWAVAACMVATGHREFKPNFPWLNVGGALLTAVTVAFLEEFFFRGALFGVLRRRFSAYRALAILTVIFSALHFIRSPKGKTRLSQVEWYTGFVELPKSFWQFSEPELFFGGFLTLFMVGWVLGYAVIKTKSLFLAIGLHAGWVFALRSFMFATRKSAEPGLWFGRDLMTGLAPLILLALTGFFLMRYFSKRLDGAEAA